MCVIFLFVRCFVSRVFLVAAVALWVLFAWHWATHPLPPTAGKARYVWCCGEVKMLLLNPLGSETYM